MEKPNSGQIILMMLILALAATGWDLQNQLQIARMENLQLRGSLEPQVTCTPVFVTCECPDYDEGYDDAEFVGGCEIPEEEEEELIEECDITKIDVEDLHNLCSELEMYGYVPDC